MRRPRWLRVPTERLTAWTGVAATTSSVLLLIGALGFVVNLAADVEEQQGDLEDLIDGLDAQADANADQLDVILRVLLAGLKRAGVSTRDLPRTVREDAQEELRPGDRSPDAGSPSGAEGRGPAPSPRRGPRDKPGPRPSRRPDRRRPCDIELRPLCVRASPTPEIEVSPTPSPIRGLRGDPAMAEIATLGVVAVILSIIIKCKRRRR